MESPVTGKKILSDQHQTISPFALLQLQVSTQLLTTTERKSFYTRNIEFLEEATQ
jgi:hypothetical protein